MDDIVEMIFETVRHVRFGSGRFGLIGTHKSNSASGSVGMYGLILFDRDVRIDSVRSDGLIRRHRLVGSVAGAHRSARFGRNAPVLTVRVCTADVTKA